MEELKEKIAIRLHTTERTVLRITCENSPLNVSWGDLPFPWQEKFREKAQEILSLFQAYLKEHNYVQLDEDQSLPENPYRTDYEELPNEFQDEATGEDVYLMAHNGVERGMRNMLKAGFKKVK